MLEPKLGSFEDELCVALTDPLLSSNTEDKEEAECICNVRSPRQRNCWKTKRKGVDSIGQQFFQQDRAGLITALALLAIVLGAIAIVLALLVASDARAQLKAMRAQLSPDESLKWEEANEGRDISPGIALEEHEVLKRGGEGDSLWARNKVAGHEVGQSGRFRRAAVKQVRGPPIPRCNCDASESEQSQNGCCCKKRENLYDSKRNKKFLNIKKAAGHFTACTPGDNDIKAGLVKGEKIDLQVFQTDEEKIYIGGQEPWTDALVTKKFFKYRPYESLLYIESNGLYLVYAQIARVGFANATITVNNVEWLLCQHRPLTNEYDETVNNGRESCSMVGVRPLIAGDTLSINNPLNSSTSKAYVVAATSTYFGIVKLD